MIELKQIHKTYYLNNRAYHALKDINLSIEQGEIFGIFGESGAGKSTLLRTINLLERPTSGTVYVAGKELTTVSMALLKEARRGIGMVFQHFNLLQSRTVFENIALPLELNQQSKSIIAKEVNALLELTHLTAYRDRYPDQLSGGQKQRVAIARALATKPRILLCDEATSALDPKSTASILALLKEVNSKLGVTVVLITHEMDVIKQICQRACVLHHGEIIELGTVLELFAKPKTEITQHLVQKTLHLELPAQIKKRLQTEPTPNKAPLVRFTFVGEDSKQPLISTLVQRYHITINIIQANIENIQDATVGFTVCELKGDAVAVQQALQSVEPSSVIVEVLGYV